MINLFLNFIEGFALMKYFHNFDSETNKTTAVCVEQFS